MQPHPHINNGVIRLMLKIPVLLFIRLVMKITSIRSCKRSVVRVVGNLNPVERT